MEDAKKKNEEANAKNKKVEEDEKKR